MFEPKPEKNLKAALEIANSLLHARRKVEDALEQTVALQPGAEAHYQSCLERQGDLEAEAVVSGVEVPADAASSVMAASGVIDSLRARAQGLRRKLMELDEPLLAAETALQTARGSYIESKIGEFSAEYTKAAEGFAEVVRRGLTIGNALGVGMPGLLAIQLFKPQALDLEVSIVPREMIGDAWQDAPVWRGNRNLEKLFAELHPLTESVVRLRELTSEIRSRRHATEQAELDRQRASRPAFTFSGGRDYETPVSKPEPQWEVTGGVGRHHPGDPERAAA